MKKWKRLLSLLLAVLMLSGALTGLTVTASADDTASATGESSDDAAADTTASAVDYLNQVFANPEEKLATMEKRLSTDTFELYADSYSGEVAVKNIKTGQILMTNPYDVAAGRVSGTDVSDGVKKELLSQILIKYTDNGKEKEFNSYEYAAERDQITVKNIKNGIRVEYVIGREEARHLVPRMITDKSFREKILAPIMENLNLRESIEAAGLLKPGQSFAELNFATRSETNPDGMTDAQYKDLIPFALKQLIAFYGGRDGMKSIENQKTDSLKKALIAKYPVLKKKADLEFWVFDSSSATTQIERQEVTIKTYAPEYSYEDMDEDHREVEYESDETNPPVFKMALEYTLDEDGFTVRLPVNGLSFNESLYQLTSISVLPYMGAGNNNYDGYVFYPDGSGALFSMEDLVSSNTTSVSSKVYGADFAYHQITGTYQQAVRYPAYGIVESTRYYTCVNESDDGTSTTTTDVAGGLYERIKQAAQDGTTIDAATHVGIADIQDIVNNAAVTEKTVKRGFVAIVEEGDALTNMVYYHAGVLSNYDTVRMDFNPRPKDSYNLADSISVGNNTEWTVITDRKYTGNFKVHYIMLDDDSDNTSGNSGINNDGEYTASWLGMAFAYRDYLEARGDLQQLTESQMSEDIPLYIESFGTEYTTEKIASIPVSVKRALTSAADVKTIYEELKEEGITNVNFKLTGYANGGMFAKMPYRLKWEKSVQKSDTEAEAMTMQELFTYAATETSGGLSLFPDFDFAYVMNTGWFDGLSMRKHVVRTIDDRYASRKEYSPTQQKYVSYYQMAISPAYMSHFYEKFLESYLEIDNLSGISVSTLGTALNSDFDEDEPYNREDSRTFIKKALAYISGEEGSGRSGRSLEIMLDGGNVYTWKYADHILNLPLDSSRYIKASYSVPFIGVLLHGYMNFAGTPLNMEGDVDYAKLKAIENGASPYFMLSYKNTEILKEYYDWSHYYSVRYDIWKDSVVDLYTELNAVLKDVQDKIIIDHEFLAGERIPDSDELMEDIDSIYDEVLDYQRNQTAYDILKQNQAISDTRALISSAEEQAIAFVENCLNYYSSMNGAAYIFSYNEAMATRLMEYMEADTNYQKVQAEYDEARGDFEGTDAEFAAAYPDLATRLTMATSDRTNKLGKMRANIRNTAKKIQEIERESEVMNKLLEDVEEGRLLIENSEVQEIIKQDILAHADEVTHQMEQALGLSFNYTVDKSGLDMVLRAHIAVLVGNCYGESLRTQAGIVGKSESIFDMILEGGYGLVKDESEYKVLRYLDANADLTDAELDAKYGLEDGKTSVAGLVTLMREIIVDNGKYTFDPIYADEKGEDGFSEIDEHLLSYYVTKLYSHVSGFADTDILPTLNFKSTRLNADTGKEVANKSNVSATTKAIKDAAKAAFDAFLKDVADGDYKTGVDELIETQIEASRALIVADAEKVEYISATNESGVLTADELLTDEALGEDLRAYLTSYYYQLALAKIKPENTVESLSILTTTSKSGDTIASLATAQYAILGNMKGASYAEIREALLQNAASLEKLQVVVSSLESVNGDVTLEIQKAYLKEMALKYVSKGNLPSGAQLPLKENKKATSEALATELVARIQAAMTDSLSIDLSDMKAEVLALMGTGEYKVKDGTKDLGGSVSNFVDAVYLMALGRLEVTSYYYDEQLGQMDKMVRESVATKHDAIVSSLPADATPAELYEAILMALGDTEDSVAQLTRAASDVITYFVESKYSISDEVQAYYINLLFAGFSDELTTYNKTAPLLTVYSTNKKGEVVQLKASDTTYKNLLKVITKNYVDAQITEIIDSAKKGTARGEIADYSLTRLLSEEEMEEWVDRIYQKLVENDYLTLEENQTEEAVKQLRSDIRDYVTQQYYQALLEDKLSAAKKTPTLHISEVYGDNLVEASSGLNKLMRYFATSLSQFTNESIDNLITKIEIDEKIEVDEESKYHTDDGRIVAVTYGNRDATDSKTYIAYKTFLLNYNNFSVSVEYDGETYTIPEYGYLVIMNE